MDWEWREISKWAWAPGLIAISVGVWFEFRKGWKGTGETLRDLGIALSTAALISLAFFGATNEIEDERARQAEEFETDRAQQAQALENLRALRVERSDNRRFVLSLSGPEERTRLFTGFDLRGQNLNFAQLWGASFNEANLTEATLLQATLNGADFRDATLICASLRQADLERGNADQSPTLVNAKLQGADLRNLDFGNADLEGAEFGSVDDADSEDLDDELDYNEALPTNLGGADLYEVQNLSPDNFLSPVIYDADTQWPQGFPLPEKADLPAEQSYPSCTPDQYRLTG